MEKRLLELMDKVFEPDEELDSENRDTTQENKELINLATSLYPHLEMDFGDEQSGNLNEENLLKLREKLNTLKYYYEQVYTFDGEIRACGRKKTIRLMEAASELYPNIYFGDTETGRMNTWKLLEYRDNIFIEYQNS